MDLRCVEVTHFAVRGRRPVRARRKWGAGRRCGGLPGWAEVDRPPNPGGVVPLVPTSDQGLLSFSFHAFVLYSSQLDPRLIGLFYSAVGPDFFEKSVMKSLSLTSAAIILGAVECNAEAVHGK